MTTNRITTEAWVLDEGANHQGSREPPAPGQLVQESYTFNDITDDEVLVEPLYGCWEGNMSHALNRTPVDICRQRGEPKVVIGNAGVVRVLKAGPSVAAFREGDLCLVFCNGVWDAQGFPKKIWAYDAPGTVGLLAKRTKLHQQQLIKLPGETRHTLPQWAAFSLRYITAWANWKVAYGCWRLSANEQQEPAPFVWGWGGGVSLAELGLAQQAGCQVALISSRSERLDLIRQLGMLPVDRRRFPHLHFSEEPYRADPAYKNAYQASEETFLETVLEQTRGRGVSIFIDFIGLPVFRATLKALARPGVITTAGWKQGMNLSTMRAIECMNWHIHVHTHYARYFEGLEAVEFGERRGWMPSLHEEVYDWPSIPRLAQDYAAGNISSYYPVFQVNAW